MTRVPSPQRIDEIAPVRVLVFLMVIAGHVMPNLEQGGASGEVGRLFQVGKYVFLAISAFIAVWMQLRRPLGFRDHVRRRMPAILVPFLVWGAAFALLKHHDDTFTVTTAVRVIGDVLIGDGAEHLYFVVLILQLTLLTPLLATLIQRTGRHHVALVIGSIVLQLVIMAWLRYAPFEYPADIRSRLLPVYAGFVIVGAVAGAHVDEVLGFIRRHPVGLILFGVVAACLHVLVFVFESRSTIAVVAERAAQSASPSQAAWGFSVLLLGLGLAALLLRVLPAASRAFRTIDALADRGYGVFLLHPLLIIAITEVLPDRLALSVPAAFAVVFPATVIGTLALVEVLIRTPLGKWTVGRSIRREHSTRQRVAVAG